MNLTPNDFRVHRIERLFSHQDKEGVVEFLNEELRPGAGFSIETEYPSLFGEFPGGGSVVLRKGNQIVAHAGYLVREVSHEDYRLRLGLIGSVVTTPDYRRLGLAGRVLEEVMSILRRRGCQLAMLWSDKTSYYGRYGYMRKREKGRVKDNCNGIKG